MRNSFAKVVTFAKPSLCNLYSFYHNLNKKTSGSAKIYNKIYTNLYAIVVKFMADFKTRGDNTGD